MTGNNFQMNFTLFFFIVLASRKSDYNFNRFIKRVHKQLKKVRDHYCGSMCTKYKGLFLHSVTENTCFWPVLPTSKIRMTTIRKSTSVYQFGIETREFHFLWHRRDTFSRFYHKMTPKNHSYALLRNNRKNVLRFGKWPGIEQNQIYDRGRLLLFLQMQAFVQISKKHVTSFKFLSYLCKYIR